MKIINARILCTIAMLGVLGSIACKKNNDTPVIPGPDDQVLSAIHRNGVLTDSFYYNKRQQVTHYKHFNGAKEIDRYCDMTYDDAGMFIAASFYIREGRTFKILEKNQATTTTRQISITGNIYNSDGTVRTPYTTILKFDDDGRFVSMVDTVHFAGQNNDLNNVRWINIVHRRYENDKLTSYESESISKKYNPATPNIDTTTSDVTTTQSFEYGNTPNKLYALGKKNPYLLVITGTANPFYAGSSNVIKTTMGNNITVFQDIDFANGFYVRTRKETTTTDGVISTTGWQFFYTPAP